MRKLFFLLILSVSLLAATEAEQCTCREPESSAFETTMFYVTVGAGAIIVAPVVMPMSTIIVVCTTVAAVTAKTATAIASTTIATKVGLGLMAVKVARPYVLQTTEEKLRALLKEKASRPAAAKDEFIKCLKAHKKDLERNSLGRPEACEEAALLFAFSAGMVELDRRTKALNDGECFCN